MSLTDYKLTDAAIASGGVVNAPDKLTGTATQNKMIFDRLIRETVKGLYNGVIDELTGGDGASDIGITAIGGVSGGNVQAALESLKTQVDAKQGTLTFDSAPTALSTNPVTSGGIKTALDGKQNTLTFDSAPTALSTNPVTSGGIKTALDGLYIRAGKKSGTTHGPNATAEGYLTTASGQSAHAEGLNTTASGSRAHAEGSSTTASGYDSHAEGHLTTASGDQSHSEGSGTTASGFAAHAEGGGTVASGVDSHAEGGGTIANHKAQHVFGEFNVADTSTANEYTRGNYVEIVGNGTEDYRRSNARTLDWDGNEVLAGKLTLGAAPTANMDAATKKYVDDAVAGAGADGDAVVIDKSDNASEDYAAIRSVLSAGKTVILRVEPPAGRYNTEAYWCLPLASWLPQKSSTTVEWLDFCGLVNDHEAARITLTGVRATNYGNWTPLSTAVLCKAADGYSASGEGTQIDFYRIAGNRVKKLGLNLGTYGTEWWLRSPSPSRTTQYAEIKSNGDGTRRDAPGTIGVAPFGCL